ncbi:MAG: HD domain-containing protein [Lachnospiraceae bacterium]|nr:HD domain-containing protein [Lachnospiraceae bacterium]
MERVNHMLAHPAYREAVRKNEEAEQKRRYCHHDMAHFLDVARIAMLLAVKEELPVSEESVYAAALVHDMGRYRQYEDGTPHERASAELAEKILLESGFSDKEAHVIIDAVRNHRNAETAKEKNLRGLLYRADKLSRACFACPVQEECNWSAEKKNLRLLV